jgi:hypothetical protein
MTLHLTGPAFRFSETPRPLQPARAGERRLGKAEPMAIGI